MQSCDICGNTLKIMNKFRCKDGYLCKDCYKKASHYYTETITHKTLEEIKRSYRESTLDADAEQFEITGRIGNYVLFDERHRKLCIANNRMTQQKVKEPEIYEIKDMKQCTIHSNPAYSIRQLEELTNQKEDIQIKSLKVVLCFSDTTKKEIILIHHSVRANSYAFRKTLDFAIRINEKIDELLKQNQKEHLV